MTAKEKIELSEYNLAKMKKGGLESNFHFDLSNFLTSAASIKWHLLYEYTEEFSLPSPRNLNPKKFEKLAKKNKNALEFIKWYNSEIELISKEGFGRLHERRNKDVHKGALPGILQVTKNTDDDLCQTSLGYYVKTKGRHYHISEIPDNEEPVQFCERYLERLKRMAHDAKRFKESL